MRGMISRGLLRWKLQMHMKFENGLCNVTFERSITQIFFSENMFLCWYTNHTQSFSSFYCQKTAILEHPEEILKFFIQKS